MGGGSSKPRGPPPPTIVEQPPPAGSGETSILYPDRPDTPRLDGISRTLADECDGCRLEVVTGATTSSVRMSREYGGVTEFQCRRYADDLKRVRAKEFSFQDFLNNLQAGRYYRNLGTGFCEQVELSNDAALRMSSINDYNEGSLRSVRIQKVTSGGFSSETKVRFTPSIPFNLRFSTRRSAPVDIVVKSMTLYHPCPLRLEGIQPDAVLSLNDPAFDNPEYVILIPLEGKNTSAPSIDFLGKIMPEVVAVSSEDPSTGQYMPKDIATGANWNLSKLFGVQAGPGQMLEVTNGYYEWKGMPALERVREQQGNTITFSWKENPLNRPPRYIMLDSTIACSPTDLAVLTQRIPVTPPRDGIHAVLYSNQIGNRGIVHKAGPPNPAACAVRESFTDVQGVTEETCDPWATWARSASRRYSTQQILNLVFGVLVAIAMGVGAFLALSAVLRMYDVEYKSFSEGLGKVTAVFFKNLKQKVTAFKGAIGTLRNVATGAMSGKDEGPGGLVGALTGEAKGSGDAEGPGGLLGALTGKQGLLSNVAGIAEPESPKSRLASAKQEQLASLASSVGRVAKTRRATIPLNRRLVGPPSVPVPTGSLPVADVVSSAQEALTPPPKAAAPPPTPAKKVSSMDYLGKRGFTARSGGLRRGRDRVSSTHRGGH